MKEKLNLKQRLKEVFRYPVNLKADSQRRQRINAHEQGHFIDEIPQDEEIVLFELPK